MRKALLLLVVLAGFVAGCENKYKDPDPAAMGYDYYPLEIGNYRIYDVTDIKFRSNVGDTNRFQLRERVDTSFYDQTNQLVFKIVRSVRLSKNSNWIDDSVMVVAKTDKMVLLTKDNTKYVKLVFPVKDGGEWIGDLFNNKLAEASRTTKVRDSKEVYTYEKVGRPFSLSDLIFDNTITVVQNNPPFDLTRIDERREVYAEGIGKVHRLFNRVVYCEGSEINSDCQMGVEWKQSGHERHEILVEYGKL